MNKITIGIVAFLLIGGYMITTDQGYDLKDDAEDRKGFLKDFSGWVVNIGKNAKEVGGVVKDQDWLPEREFEEHTDNDTAK
ncbi:MAG: hypothetical protein CMH64_03295 [Nanoarchaeota archaeon]|nr:hypothetical protein [Nanoarchaeota archaeon]|tara:strand:+ start:710 stop:952 length:243 start_codon:yes stop_codon:yes gene_type:complete